ncbi:MAG: alcohol dehydrogenase catalytic domain-containing protein [Clostridia bacterium]|nr:alcohol dehydrogenase catalytic domain-containing protein [Clostridia bacterium]
MTKLERYKKVDYELPNKYLRWPLYGAGLENVGKQGKPIEVEMPEIKPNEVLLRVDAVGLCFSDIKVVNQGNKHPRITGRDLENDPAVLGHEATLTVVKAGEQRQDQYKIGNRYLIQADVFYKGVSMAFGYVLPGGMQQYVVVGDQILDGDEGSYLIPVDDSSGYAEVALSEPWACVEAALRIEHRNALKNGGIAWFVGFDNAKFDEYTISNGFDKQNHPAKVVVSNVKGKILEILKEKAAQTGAEFIEDNGIDNIDEFAEEYAKDTGFDDIVVLGTPTPEFVELASDKLANKGIFAIVADTPVARKVSIDGGRIHYDGTGYVGTMGTDIADAYAHERTSELFQDGKIFLMGAGGPMGQMYTQRAADTENGPKMVVVSDIDDNRLGELKERFAHLADRRGAAFKTINPNKVKPEEFDKFLSEASEGEKFTDVVAFVPVPALIGQAGDWLGDNGYLNIFAGIARGTKVNLDISGTYMKGHRWVGSSGSRLADLKYTLKKTEQGLLSPNQSVAAIGGLNVTNEGLRAVKEGRFPGKVVIWPQLPDLPLIPLPEMKDKLPNVAEKLDRGKFWTKEAEEELLNSKLEI